MKIKISIFLLLFLVSILFYRLLLVEEGSETVLGLQLRQIMKVDSSEVSLAPLDSISEETSENNSEKRKPEITKEERLKAPPQPEDPYAKLRSEGQQSIKNDTLSYIESTIKLEKNINQQESEQAKSNGPSPDDPYAKLREARTDSDKVDTTKYVDSTLVLSPKE